jgi:hypothetical protein
MTQLALIILLFKIGLICGFFSVLAWIALYTYVAKWWSTQVGWTLVIMKLLVAALFLVAGLGMIFPWFRVHPLVAGWIDVVLVGLTTPAMCWRSWVWWRLHRAGQLSQDADAATQPASPPEQR